LCSASSLISTIAEKYFVGQYPRGSVRVGRASVQFETLLKDELAGLIFVGNILVSESDLIQAGTIAIVLDDETIHDVPSQELRRRSTELGQDRIKAFMMAPVEFEKFRAVMRRREEQAAA
jgi:hypothetical protein